MIRYDKVNRKAEALSQRLHQVETENVALREQSGRIKQVLDSTLHEVRRFSGELASHAESLSRLLELNRASEEEIELCQTVFYTTGMISARLGFTDLELNPSAVSRQATIRAGVYKKFEKAKHVLGLKSRLKRVPILFRGNSYFEIDALPAFELVPFVILDNAIKYSLVDRQVSVQFEERANQSLTVTVQSVGPLVEGDEIPHLFDRGYRGKHAGTLAGDGLGLYLTKFLCDYHDIEISAGSTPITNLTVNRVPYGEFSITLSFNRHW